MVGGAMVLCSAPPVAAVVRSGVTVWRPDALLGCPCNVVWCCVAGSVAAVVSRAGAAASVGVTALGCSCRSSVATVGATVPERWRDCVKGFLMNEFQMRANPRGAGGVRCIIRLSVVGWAVVGWAVVQESPKGDDREREDLTRRGARSAIKGVGADSAPSGNFPARARAIPS